MNVKRGTKAWNKDMIEKRITAGLQSAKFTGIGWVTIIAQPIINYWLQHCTNQGEQNDIVHYFMKEM